MSAITITELHNRLIIAESAIATLTSQLNHPYQGSTMKTSVPLRSMNSEDYRNGHPSFNANRYKASHTYPRYNEIPQENRTSLADVIKANEEVTIQVNTGKDADGNQQTTTAIANFNGTDLIVTKCDLVPSFVGTTSPKPGEILYKFINELKERGHITRTFTVPPWKLCSVVRDGQRQTLSELRAQRTQQ
jgi:hypothetical protein